MTGGNGDDTLTGSAGVNILTGGLGNDVLAGLAGNDTIFGDAGNDTILYTMGDGADVVDGGEDVGDADIDTLSITGTAGNDVLDVVVVAGVITTVEGGAVVNVEAITADLGAGTGDTLSYTGTGNLTVNLVTGAATGFATAIVGVENVSTNGANDILTGDGLINNLNAGGGDDTIFGNAGADVLNGGAGADTITGGAGADAINVGAAVDNLVDLVIYTELTDGADTIANFDSNDGTNATDDMVIISGNLALALDDLLGAPDGLITFHSGNNANGGNQAVNLNNGVEGLFLSGLNGEGVNNSGLTNATTVANEFNAEFGITSAAGGDTLLVVNLTNSSNFAVWRYLETGVTTEIQAAELTLMGVFTSNADAVTVQFDFA